jgi:hypothetical protein
MIEMCPGGGLSMGISLWYRLSMRTMRTSLPRVTKGLDKNRGLLAGPSLVPVGWVEIVAYMMAARRSGREKGDGLSKARRLRLLVGTFLLALSVILSGCSGSVTQEQKQEKKKMLKKKEETDKEKKKEK